MKTPLVPLLLLSLAGNAALALFVLRPASIHPASTAVSPAVASAQVAPAASTAAMPLPPPAAPVNWQTLKPGQNLHSLVDNLRAAGFPPAVIRAVVNQMIAERLDSGATDHLPFWKQNYNNPEYRAAQQEQSARRRELFNELLGADARPSAMMEPAARERRYGQLSDDKIDQIENLNRDYGELRSKLYAERKSGDMTGVMSAQAAVEQEQRKELATILTPAELEQYEMRTSRAASQLMSNLKSVDVSEAEYTALFRAQQAFDQMDLARVGGVTPDAMAQRFVAQDALNEQARTVLTDDRYYEYLKGADPQYARTAQFTAKYPDITPAMTYDLTKIEREYQVTTMSIARPGAGGTLSADRTAQLMAARKDYQDKINALLGPEVGAAYAQRNRTGVITQTIRTGPGGG
jgi:hypothetical protein